VLRLFERIPELRRVLNTDVLPPTRAIPPPTASKRVFSYPAIRATIRIAHVLYTEGVLMIPRIWSIAAFRDGNRHQRGAQIGESFFIDHGTGVVIGETMSSAT
jgi:serine O-acetyltransferase